MTHSQTIKTQFLQQFEFQYQQLLRDHTLNDSPSNKLYEIVTVYVQKKECDIFQILANDQLSNQIQGIQQSEQVYLLRQVVIEEKGNQKELSHMSDHCSIKQTDSTHIDSEKKTSIFKAIQSLEQLNVKKLKFCNCKKSMCVKNYCQCYRANRNCSEECVCIGCTNRDEQILQTRTKKKKILKVIVCKCTKSQCLKKYCECFNMHKKCSAECKCGDCKNHDEKVSEIQPYQNLVCTKKIKLQQGSID